MAWTSKPLRRLHELALTYPGAWEDHPWGDTVVKVGKKIFVFLGEGSEFGPGITIKLPDSAEPALMLGCTERPGYGLGKAGWVSVHLDGADCPSVDVLGDWLDESYRAIAPKKLVRELDDSMGA